jgi:hypothetical protein
MMIHSLDLRVVAVLSSRFGLGETEARAAQARLGYSLEDLDEWTRFRDSARRRSEITDPDAYTARLMRSYRSPAEAGKPWFRATKKLVKEKNRKDGLQPPRWQRQPIPWERRLEDLAARGKRLFWRPN